MEGRNIILIVTVTLITLMVILAAIVFGHMYKTSFNNSINNINIEEQENCQHDWVITSKYDWGFGEFKTISKCTKCGKEI